MIVVRGYDRNSNSSGSVVVYSVHGIVKWYNSIC
jgi:hypothetical protein